MRPGDKKPPHKRIIIKMQRTRMAIQLKQSWIVYTTKETRLFFFFFPIAPIIYLRQFGRPRKECCFSLSLSADYNKMGNTRWRLSRSIESLVMWTLLWKWNTARCSGRRRRHRLLVHTPSAWFFLRWIRKWRLWCVFLLLFLVFRFFIFLFVSLRGNNQRYLFCWFTAI